MTAAFFQKGSWIHNLFEITIFVKGFNGVFEILIGLLFLFSKGDNLHRLMLSAANRGLAALTESPVHYLTSQAGGISPSTQFFIAIYFLFYGAVNIFLVIFLVQGKLWAYPVAITCFTGFIVYQIYRFYLHHSGLLLFLTFFDVFLVALTFLEYRRIRRQSMVPPT